MRKNICAQFLLLSLMLLLASCSSSGTTESDLSYEDKSTIVWILESFGTEQENQTTATTGVNSTFSFNWSSDRAVTSFTGFDGCNHYEATVVSPEAGHLEVVDSVPQDGAFCEELQYSDYLDQTAYLYSVFDEFSFEYNLDERMRLRTPDNKLLVFKQCGPLDIQALDQACVF